MAYRPTTALLRLPHQGRPLNLVCAADDRLRIFALAQAALHSALGAVGAAAQLSTALHRQYRGLDDSRTGPSAVAHLWPDAHQRRLLEYRLRQQRTVHLAWLDRKSTRLNSSHL